LAELPPGPQTPRALQTARWIARPAAFMDDAQRRYGDMFTLRITHEGTWVFLSHPDAVKQVFTGDPRLLHAGEANIVLLPVLGSNSVLLLDDDAHMAQRKLMLPPFHGERMRGYEQIMAEVAAREVERWPAGQPLPAWPTMQAITLEVIVRTVFGVRDRARIERLAEALKGSLGLASQPLRMAVLAALARVAWRRPAGSARGSSRRTG
jgi:cytochrome P450 family 135